MAEEYQLENDSYYTLAFSDRFFSGIDPSMKFNHNWSKLRDVYKSLVKSYGEVHENHKIL